MKCHKHYEMDAVSTCVDCGKAMCPQCTEKFTSPICDRCNLSRIKNNRNTLIKNSVIMSVIMIVFFIISFNNAIMHGSFFSALIVGYIFASIPWGWSTLSKITPNIFLFMPVIGWVIYYVIKFVLSLIIGMFVAPFRIIHVVKRLKKSKELEIYTKQAS